MKRVRVLIIEDSPVVQNLLTAIVESDARFEVVAAVTTAEEALRRLPVLKPDVISLDIRLPGIDGLEATRRIMAEHPTPIVVISASVDSDNLNIALNALRCGALTVLEKPLGVKSPGFRKMADNILTQLYIMSQVKVLRLWGNSAYSANSRTNTRFPAIVHSDVHTALAIGCSTGGPNALSVVLRDLPAGFSWPILVAQHLPPSFIPSFASWLALICRFPVKVVQEPQFLQPGCIYLAAPERHLGVAGGCAVSSDAPSIGGQRPSATYLFRSMKREFGSSAVGVLLTGMGEDGAEGLLDMRRAGACTIAEDETTAVIYGMPGAACALGAVRESLPLTRIASRLGEIFGAPQKGF